MPIETLLIGVSISNFALASNAPAHHMDGLDKPLPNNTQPQQKLHRPAGDHRHRGPGRSERRTHNQFLIALYAIE